MNEWMTQNQLANRPSRYSSTFENCDVIGQYFSVVYIVAIMPVYSYTE